MRPWCPGDDFWSDLGTLWESPGIQKAANGGTKWSPKLLKMRSKMQAVFGSPFLVLLEGFRHPNWSFLGDILIRKQIFCKMSQPCDFTAPAAWIRGSGPSKRDQNWSQNRDFCGHGAQICSQSSFYRFWEAFWEPFWLKIGPKGL